MADRMEDIKAELRVAEAHRSGLLSAYEQRYADHVGWLIAEVERLRDLAAAVQAFAIAEEQIEEAVRQRGPDIGPESHRACVERMNLRAAAQVLLVTGDDGAVRRNR